MTWIRSRSGWCGRAARRLRGDGRRARQGRPLGQHQGAPRRLVARCSTPTAQMVMQAEHIPVHLGAMPDAVAAVAGEDHARRAPWILNDPYAGGTHLPDITVITPVLARRRPARLRRQPRPPRRRRRPHARLDARRLDHARGRGRRDRAARARRRRDRASSSPRCASPQQRRADLRAQLAANRAGAKRLGELAERLGADGLREATDAVARLRRAAHARLHRGARGRRRATPRTCSRRADGDLHLQLTATVAGDELTLDFTGSADQHDGNLNCPLAVTALGLLLRRARAHRPRHPADRRRLPARHRAAPEGSLLNARSPGGGRGRQRRDLLARRRPRARRLRPRARPGDDEQPHARRRRLHLLRDARRRPGRVRGRRRPERRARGDVATRSTRRSRRSSWSSRCGS